MKNDETFDKLLTLRKKVEAEVQSEKARCERREETQLAAKLKT